ncbi:fimbrial protein [Citrobacter rodentium]|uniref:Fimbrial subunit n=2 Tax=Citrobacter rodentium TaxID=67825 RepID=D2TQS4_CITRI|nr:fimbrial protein [Citrobacter rodentium]KIQ49783.1 fimbrial protein [Citrobacter rodentium]QBY29864.1 type 1 fimbrial protein [Citrobacter rodentium]UHO32747.1 type 1 fimbrial protein [Citrobacter rodentium NBRC 105723 = DSM 16636]CBG90210.1 putative fimbrial subunit [Citrobacter rodentium ICC168]HAT8014183.1 type 1 fimbrial protein [Citrobacter rodentium NBRC 105723 = DSM 16636]
MKSGNAGLLSLCLCALLATDSAAGSTVTPGKLAMSGEIIEAACSLDPTSRDVQVEFGDVSASQINRNDEGNLSRPFWVRLTGCSIVKRGLDGSLYPYASVTFIGSAAAADPTTLLIRGKADGFGIRFRDSHGEILTLGQPSRGYELSDTDNALKFSASLVPLEKYIKAGEFSAVAQFFMDYN